jgi:hypothetical protein
MVTLAALLLSDGCARAQRSSGWFQQFIVWPRAAVENSHCTIRARWRAASLALLGPVERVGWSKVDSGLVGGGGVVVEEVEEVFLAGLAEGEAVHRE